MLEKIIVVLLLFACMLAGDGRRLKHMSRKEVAGYAVVILPAVYLALIFLFNTTWPNLTDLLRMMYGQPAGQLVELIE
ncbi:hypothetical protein [Paenibacillus eucommiae]|uniref:Kef-type K+ transport system membrane component KefB n=1 Tax=Paenibacillus eucommiae TaxID=1355755 RepID=A0ABS4IU63_9BACL|nr:hypothetical protein [Paenibacillus eucommiae]MBP1991119.1 Kef-type K+ transport system membrane component KefB [Paenibacillus eucommiae]